ETDVRTNIAGARGKIAEQLLIARVTGTQHDELQGQVTQFGGNGGDEIEALLVHEPTDDAYHRQSRIIRQSELPTQGCAITHFGRCCVGGRILNLDVTIRRRIPGIPIETIGNTKDARVALKEHLIETPAMI